MISGVDPGFPQRRGTNPKGGAQTNYSVKLCSKLHENEDNWTGGGRPKVYYVDSPLDISVIVENGQKAETSHLRSEKHCCYMTEILETV